MRALFTSASASATAALALAACAGARGGAVQAPVELVLSPIGSGAVTRADVPGGGQCTLKLVAGRIRKSSSTCYVDEHISEGAGLLLYPCSGTGPAEAQFGPQRYTGQILRGEVELSFETEMDWEDGCRWGTRARIHGVVLSDGQASRKRVAWRYEDRVLSGSDCSGVCRARTTMGVGSGASDDDGDDGHEDDEEDDEP